MFIIKHLYIFYGKIYIDIFVFPPVIGGMGCGSEIWRMEAQNNLEDNKEKKLENFKHSAEEC